jgi:hypothetical protein
MFYCSTFTSLSLAVAVVVVVFGTLHSRCNLVNYRQIMFMGMCEEELSGLGNVKGVMCGREKRPSYKTVGN